MAVSLFALLVLAVAALTVATSIRVTAREAAERRSHPPEGEFITIGGVRLHIVVRGEGRPDVRDLVLIHGASGAARDFTFDIAEKLTGPYRLFIPDRPGFGYSEPAPGEGLRDQAKILSQAVELLGARDPIVLGHSYGGAVALAWGAEKLPASGLVLVSAPSQVWKGGMPLFYRITSSWWGQRFAVPLFSAWVRRSTMRDAVAEVFEPDAVPTGYGKHFGPFLSATPQVLRINARQRKALKHELEVLGEDYGSIDIPVEIIHGTADQIVPIEVHSRPLVTQLPNARLTELDGIGHMPHHARPGAVIAAIDRVDARLR